jgi:hypothetical protein
MSHQTSSIKLLWWTVVILKDIKQPFPLIKGNNTPVIARGESGSGKLIASFATNRRGFACTEPTLLENVTLHDTGVSSK